MMTEGYGDIIHRMMRQPEEEDNSPTGAPRCHGCGKREPLYPYERITAEGDPF